MSAANNEEEDGDQEAYFLDYIPPARDAITLPRNVVFVLIGVVLVLVATYAIVGHLIRDLMHDLAGNLRQKSTCHLFGALSPNQCLDPELSRGCIGVVTQYSPRGLILSSIQSFFMCWFASKQQSPIIVKVNPSKCVLHK